MNNCYDFELIKTLKDIIQSVVLIINIILIVVIFRSNKKREDRNRENDKKSTWFRKLLVEPHFQEIPKLFENLKLEVKNLQDSLSTKDFEKLTVGELNGMLKKSIHNINERITLFKNEFIDIVHSLDENFAKVLVRFMEDLRDQLTETIDEINKNGPSAINELSQNIKDKKVSFTKLLYDYDMLLK